MYVFHCEQINARLYAFDASTHSWKERGRGDIHLNDACQREGVFQSRLGEGNMYTQWASLMHVCMWCTCIYMYIHYTCTYTCMYNTFTSLHV